MQAQEGAARTMRGEVCSRGIARDSPIMRKRLLVIGGMVAFFVLGMIFGQAVSSGECRYICPLLPSVYNSDAPQGI